MAEVGVWRERGWLMVGRLIGWRTVKRWIDLWARVKRQ